MYEGTAEQINSPPKNKQNDVCICIYTVFGFCLSRHRIEIEEIIECASKELNLEMQLSSIEEEWTEQVKIPSTLTVHRSIDRQVLMSIELLSH